MRVCNYRDGVIIYDASSTAGRAHRRWQGPSAADCHGAESRSHVTLRTQQVLTVETCSESLLLAEYEDLELRDILF
jgi:hypothetical protein